MIEQPGERNPQKRNREEKLFLGERIGNTGRRATNRYVIVHEYFSLGTHKTLIDYATIEYVKGYVAGAMSGKWENVAAYLGIPVHSLNHFKRSREIGPLHRLTLRRLRSETALFYWYPDLEKRIAR